MFNIFTKLHWREQISMVEDFLNSQELAIFRGIRDYLSQNRFFRLNDIIPYLNQTLDKSLNLNAVGIEKIIHSLLKKHVVVPGYKLTWKDVLLNELRENIYEYIEQNPASYLNQIMKALGIGSHQTLWHLGILEEFEFIRKTKIGRKKIYFPADSVPAHDEFHFYMKNKKVMRILKLFQSEHAQKLTKSEMAS